MKAFQSAFGLILFVCLTAFVFGGCASTESENTDVAISGYYGAGVGFYDPWYYGPGYYPPEVIVTPPPGRPIDPPHVENPIVLPSPAPAPRPLPSIPSSPRVAPRR